MSDHINKFNRVECVEAFERILSNTVKTSHASIRSIYRSNEQYLNYREDLNLIRKLISSIPDEVEGFNGAIEVGKVYKDREGNKVFISNLLPNTYDTYIGTVFDALGNVVMDSLDYTDKGDAGVDEEFSIIELWKD